MANNDIVIGYKRRIYCKTDDRWEYCWDTDKEITECPIDAAHEVDSKSSGIADVTKFVTIESSDGDYRMFAYSVFADTSAGDVKIKPPDAKHMPGGRFVIKKEFMANKLTIDPDKSDINGESKLEFEDEKIIILIESDGENWHSHNFYEGRSLAVNMAASSTSTTGIKLADKGEIAFGGEILPLDTDGKVLSLDSTSTTGFKWINPGSHLSFAGDWSSKNYVQDDLVFYNNQSYVCIQNTTANQNPSNSSYWTLFAGQGVQGVQGIQGIQGEQGDQGPQGLIGPSGVGTFGQYYKYADTNTQHTNKTTSWNDHLTLTTDVVVAGYYRIGWCYTWMYRHTGRDFISQITLDGLAIDSHRQEPKDSGTDQRFAYSKFKRVQLSAGTHTVKIQFRTSTNNTEARIREGRLEFWRVP